jgi:hypothetical protein
MKTLIITALLVAAIVTLAGIIGWECRMVDDEYND